MINLIVSSPKVQLDTSQLLSQGRVGCIFKRLQDSTQTEPTGTGPSEDCSAVALTRSTRESRRLKASSNCLEALSWLESQKSIL